MEVKEAILKRYSCREFSNECIKDNEINEILESARLAPTAVNFQPVRIYVVKSEEKLLGLKEATKWTFDSKCIFVLTHDKTISWHRKNDDKDHGDIDCAIAATHMTLTATSLGIGSCYVCSMREEIVKKVLDISDNEEVCCMLPMGYPKTIGHMASRHDLDSMVIYK